jgi:MFS family permease
VRSTVLGFYTGGVYIGAGLGLFIGGVSLQLWKHAWPIAANAPFGLKGWQAAFMIVGLPGVLMALWVATLREPARGQGDDIVVHDHPRPFYEALLVLGTMLPILNWWTMWLSTRSLRAIVINVSSLVAVALTAFAMIRLTGDVAQWIGLGIGVYAAISWGQGLFARDRLVMAMIFRCRTMRNVIVAGGTTTFLGVAFAFWSVPFIQRYHGVGPAEAGAMLGLSFALMGFLGTALGGWAADALRAVTPRGKLYVWLTGVIISCVAAICFLSVSNLRVAYTCIFVMNLSLAAAQGPQFSTINDLCLPRGRATTSAFAYMVATFLGIALGPYVTGHLSDMFVSAGLSSGEALRRAMLWSLLLPAVGNRAGDRCAVPYRQRRSPGAGYRLEDCGGGLAPPATFV